VSEATPILAPFDHEAAVAERAGDRRLLGRALVDRGIVRFACGLADAAQSDLDGAGDAFNEAGDPVAASAAASAASLVARLRGDLHGAIARAQFARGWAPRGTVGMVAAQLSIAEAALDAGNLAPGFWAHLEATNVLGEAALPEPTRRRLAAYADWLNADDNAAKRPATPAIAGAPAPTETIESVADALRAGRPIERAESEVGFITARLAAAFVALRAGQLQTASQAFADAHLLGRPVPPEGG
jgi:hypothetical protein